MSALLLHHVDRATRDQLDGILPDSIRLVSADHGEAPPRGQATARLVRVRGGDPESVEARIRDLAAESPGVPILVLVPLGRMDLAVRATRAGAVDVLPDPVDARLLGPAVERALENASLRRELERLRATRPRDRGPLIGESPAMRDVFRLIDRMAPAPSSVLITGESGTGKELVARALHAGSPRARGHFVAVNCAAVPEALLESELFGHVKGAFTDAHASRTGLFAQAAGGTLFLDEVGDLPGPLQPKLLRVLQERTMRPVGGDREVALDVRLIAATHQDLDALVASGRFRADLLYRLDVLRLELPPLRERGNDVLLLAQRFLAEHAARMGRPTPGLPTEVARLLLDHDWPGNARELQNAMERAAALAEDAVAVTDLPPRLQRLAVSPTRPAPRAALPVSDPHALPTLAEVERTHILRVLDAVDGQRARAATILGLDRKTLWRKLKGWGLAED